MGTGRTAEGEPEPPRSRGGLLLLARVLAMCLPLLAAAGCGGPKIPAAGPAADEASAPAGGGLAGDLYAADDGDGPPEALSPVFRPDEQLLILEVRLRDLILADGMFGYLDEGGLLLPLSEFARSLEFPVSVDPVNGRAGGWFISENRLFSLDILRRRVVVDGRSLKYNPQLVELHEDDIYVDSRLLADWFPVDISFDLANLIVSLKGREPLPIDERLARETRRGKALAQRARLDADYPQAEFPYRWVDWPVINLNAEAGYTQDTLGNETVTSRYGLLFNGDLLKHSASLFIGGNQDRGVSDVRFMMGRKDPDGEMLGFLHVTEYSMGDIVTPPVDMVARARFGRGAQVSSFPLSRTGTFDSTTLVGELPVGWEVELYRNGVLLDFRSSRGDGRYEFADVPLLFGLNIIQLQFFGPQGQYREETDRILVGPGQVKPGTMNFRLAASQQDERLVPLDSADALSPADQALLGEPRGSLELEYGVNKHISLAASGASVPLAAGRKSYGGMGLRLGLGPFYGKLDGVRDSEGGTAGKFGAQVNLPLHLILMAEHGIYNDFSSEEIEDDGDLPVSISEGRLEGALPLWQGRRIPFSFSGRHEKSVSGATETRAGNRLSLALGRLSMSNELNWQRNQTAAASTTVASGSFLAGGRLWGIGIRGNAAYTIEPVKEVTSAAVTAEWLSGKGLFLRGGAARSFVAGVNTYSAAVSKRFKWFSAGLTGSYADDGSSAVMFTLGMTAMREPHGGDWSLHSADLAGKGAASALVFLDNDFDGKFSEGDEPVEGVGFETGRALAPQKTDENGIALLTGLPANRDVAIAVPPRGLEDPYWIAQPEGYSVPLRAGTAARLEFPIVVTGEVDGTVVLRRGNNMIPVSDAVIQLVDGDGQVAGEATSAFDGFYLLESVRPGVYGLRLDPEQAARLGLSAGAPRIVEIRGDGTVVSGMDFIIDSTM